MLIIGVLFAAIFAALACSLTAARISRRRTRDAHARLSDERIAALAASYRHGLD